MDYVTTRFSVKFANRAHILYDLLSKYKPFKFHVTGTADTVLDWGHCTEQQLLDLMDLILHWNYLDEAFQNIITRVGIKYKKPINSRKAPYNCSTFLNDIPTYKSIMKFLTNSKQMNRWCYPVAKLLGTLQAMCQNSVLDDLSELLVPGVSAFFQRIEYLGKNNKWSSDMDDDFSEFLDRWSSLSNDIYHLESQMVQYPELNTVRYYIPAMVLQFHKAVVDGYVRIVKDLDKKYESSSKTGNRLFVPILFPSSEENVSTKCFLDPQYDIAYTGSCPLCISLPLHRLYQPWEVAYILIHEMSHYCGDNLRQRKVRLEHVINGSAAYVLQFLLLYLNSPNSAATIKSERNFQKDIAEKMNHMLCVKTDEDYYLSYVGKNLPVAMFQIATNPAIQTKLQNIIMEGISPEEQLRNIYYVCRADTLSAGYTINKAFKEHIGNCVLYLYKECYADILMILLLSCSFAEYYHCVYEEEYECFDGRWQNHNEERILESHTDRMATVMIVMENLQPDWSKDAECFSSTWVVKAWEKMVEWKKSGKKSGISRI